MKMTIMQITPSTANMFNSETMTYAESAAPDRDTETLEGEDLTGKHLQSNQHG